MSTPLRCTNVYIYMYIYIYIYIETGLLDVETIMDTKRLNMMTRLHRQKSKLMTIILANAECVWMKKQHMK